VSLSFRFNQPGIQKNVAYDKMCRHIYVTECIPQYNANLATTPGRVETIRRPVAT